MHDIILCIRMYTDMQMPCIDPIVAAVAAVDRRFIEQCEDGLGADLCQFLPPPELVQSRLAIRAQVSCFVALFCVCLFVSCFLAFLRFPSRLLCNSFWPTVFVELSPTFYVRSGPHILSNSSTLCSFTCIVRWVADYSH